MILCHKTDDWWKASVVEDDEIVSTITLKEYDDVCMVVHQEVYKWTPRIYRIFKEAFEHIKQGVKKQGWQMLVTMCSDCDDWAKRKKYWERMGFTVLTEEQLNSKIARGAWIKL